MCNNIYIGFLFLSFKLLLYFIGTKKKKDHNEERITNNDEPYAAFTINLTSFNAHHPMVSLRAVDKTPN